jgi:hypothetical protein
MLGMGWAWSTRPRPIHQLGVVLYGRRPPCNKSQRAVCCDCHCRLVIADHHCNAVEDCDVYTDCIQNCDALAYTHAHKNAHIIAIQDQDKNSVKHQNSITDTNSLAHTDGNPDQDSNSYADTYAHANRDAHAIANNYGHAVTPGASTAERSSPPVRQRRTGVFVGRGVAATVSALSARHALRLPSGSDVRLVRRRGVVVGERDGS